MGERKGVNKYYPPDYDPNKGGLNKFVGSHALRERARKLHLGILIIRFELPYNIWCDGCENHIGMGVRYNAEKKKIGMYYSTPIYQFRMKCHLCDNHFEIKTDPANLDYVIVSGARRQENRWDPFENEQVVPEDKNVSRKMTSDAMFRLEHGVDDKAKAKDVKNTIENLEDLRNSRWKDDYSANLALRQRLRNSRMEYNLQKEKDAALNLDVPLLPPTEEDKNKAMLLQFSKAMNSAKTAKERQTEINNESVFAKCKTTRISTNVKKDVARRAIHNILNKRAPPSSPSANISVSKLGIKKKGTLDTRDSQSNDNQPQNAGTKALIVSYDSSESD